jgi:hypothetical protein
VPTPASLPTSIAAGNTGHVTHTNTVHRLLNALSIVPASKKTAAYTFALSDCGEVVEVNASRGVTITVPANVFPAGAIVALNQYGRGTITVAAGSGLTLRTASSLTTRTQYSEVSIRFRSTTEAILSGDLT